MNRIIARTREIETLERKYRSGKSGLSSSMDDVVLAKLF